MLFLATCILFLSFFSQGQEGQKFPQFLQLPDDIKGAIFDYAHANNDYKNIGNAWLFIGILDKSIDTLYIKEDLIDSIFFKLYVAGSKWYYRQKDQGILIMLNLLKYLKPDTRKYMEHMLRKVYCRHHAETIGWSVKHPYCITGTLYEAVKKIGFKVYREQKVDGFDDVIKFRRWFAIVKIVLHPSLQIDAGNNPEQYACFIKLLQHPNNRIKCDDGFRCITDETGKYIFNRLPKYFVEDEEHKQLFLVVVDNYSCSLEQVLLSQHPLFKQEQNTFYVRNKRFHVLPDYSAARRNKVDDYTKYVYSHVKKLPCTGIAMTKQQMFERIDKARSQKYLPPLSGTHQACVVI